MASMSAPMSMLRDSKLGVSTFYRIMDQSPGKRGSRRSWIAQGAVDRFDASWRSGAALFRLRNSLGVEGIELKCAACW
jgi:hypothetical protein